MVGTGAQGLGGVGTLRLLDTSLAPPEAFLGVLGGPGLTGYAGLLHIAGLRDRDVVWVSAAAGAVGSLAVQIAKLRGHRVIGSAGSDETVGRARRLAAPGPRRWLRASSLGRNCSGHGCAAARRVRHRDCAAERDLAGVRPCRGGSRCPQPLPGGGQRPGPAGIPRLELPASASCVRARWRVTGGSATARPSSSVWTGRRRRSSRRSPGRQPARVVVRVV